MNPMNANNLVLKHAALHEINGLQLLLFVDNNSEEGECSIIGRVYVGGQHPSIDFLQIKVAIGLKGDAPYQKLFESIQKPEAAEQMFKLLEENLPNGYLGEGETAPNPPTGEVL